MILCWWKVNTYLKLKNNFIAKQKHILMLRVFISVSDNFVSIFVSLFSLMIEVNKIKRNWTNISNILCGRIDG